MVAGLTAVSSSLGQPPEFRRYCVSTSREVAAKHSRSGHPSGHLFGAIKPGAGGEPEADRVHLGYRGLPLANLDARPSGVYFAVLRAGDIIPGFGSRVCGVGDMEVPREGMPSTFFIETLAFPPPGTQLQPDGFAVPLAGKGDDYTRGTLRILDASFYEVRVQAITKGAAGAPARATLVVEYALGKRPPAVTAGAGDVLFHTGVGHRIRAVVPPDPRSGVVGWVEFDPAPLTDEQAKGVVVQTGGKVLRP